MIDSNLEQKLKKAQAIKKRNAFLLVVPLLVFLCIGFVFPILKLLYTSIDNPQVSTYLPKTTQAIQDWDGKEIPDEAVFEALVVDLIKAKKDTTFGQVSRRLNFEVPGARSIVNRLARKAHTIQAPYKENVLKADKRWDNLLLWQTIQRESAPYTLSYYVSAFDMEYNEKGEIVRVSESKQIYITLFIRTLLVGVVITFLCFILGFPVAHMLATLPSKISNLLMILVLLPFWTSLLVRTTSWIAVLQSEGVLNDVLVFFGILDEESRVRLVYNMTGTIVAMTHILLPFMILPLYSIMRTIPKHYMYAARSMGASWFRSFTRVYFPLTLPGVSAGGLLVFILAIGYFITPALVGGSSGQLISNIIDYHINGSLNWGLAAALSSVLFVSVLILYWLYNKLIGIDKLKF